MMKPFLRFARLSAWAVIFGLLPPSLATAAPEYLRYYKTGLTAADTKDWEQVDKMMRRAIEGHPEERRRRGLRRNGYYPHFYLGLARYNRGDCRGALASWAESEDQGAIVGRDEYVELLRFQADCQKNGAPSSAGRSSASATNKKTGKEKVRTGQLWVEKSADPARRSLSAVEGAAPEGSDLGKLAHQGQKVVDVAETATDLVDLALPPSKELEAAIDAYFAGNPQRTLELLEAINLSDPRAKAQIYLFRAAASFRLHLLAGHDEARLGTARKNADLFQQAQWRKDFPIELFDPRFVRFLRGGG